MLQGVMMAMMLAMMMKHAVDDDQDEGYLAMRQRFSHGDGGG